MIERRVCDEGLPTGAWLSRLEPHTDARGALTEIFRAEWDTGVAPVQWNLVHSAADVLRGVHLHPRHHDYLVVVHGRATIGLRDLRPGSPTEGIVALVDMAGDHPTALTIPPGVAHGILFHQPSTLLFAVSHYWDPDDEIACYWDDPELGIPWPVVSPRLSQRDASAPPLAAVRHLAPPYA
jgi:dTDP-4-dehydrorhamnose 3,5-epimerase